MKKADTRIGPIVEPLQSARLCLSPGKGLNRKCLLFNISGSIDNRLHPVRTVCQVLFVSRSLRSICSEER